MKAGVTIVTTMKKKVFVLMFAIAAVVVPFCPKSHAQEVISSAETQFEEAYKILCQADDARDRRAWGDAIRLYGAALEKYLALSKRYPDFQPAVTKYRIQYSNSQMESILRRVEKKGLSDNPPQNMPSLTPRNSSAELKQIKSAAKLLMKDGNIAKAKTVLMDGLKQNPDDLPVRLMLATIQCQDGEFEAASLMVDSLLRDAPSNPEVHLLSGTIAFAEGRLDDACKAIEKALDLDPAMRAAHYDMARLLIEKSPPDVDAAKFHYQKALDLGAIPDRNLEHELAVLGGPPASALPEQPDASGPPPSEQTIEKSDNQDL